MEPKTVEELQAEVERLQAIIDGTNAKKQTRLLSKADVVLFFAEAFARWGKKSPKYMRIWKSVNWVISSLAGLPYALAQLHVIVQPRWAVVVEGIVMFSSLYGSAMNSLVVAKPEPDAMPLTEKKQLQEEIKVINSLK